MQSLAYRPDFELSARRPRERGQINKSASTCSIYAQPERMTILNQIEPPFSPLIAKNRGRSSIARILVGLANQLEEAQSAITLLASKFSFIDGFQSAA